MSKETRGYTRDQARSWLIPPAGLGDLSLTFVGNKTRTWHPSLWNRCGSLAGFWNTLPGPNCGTIVDCGPLRDSPILLAGGRSRLTKCDGVTRRGNGHGCTSWVCRGTPGWSFPRTVNTRIASQRGPKGKPGACFLFCGAMKRGKLPQTLQSFW